MFCKFPNPLPNCSTYLPIGETKWNAIKLVLQNILTSARCCRPPFCYSARSSLQDVVIQPDGAILAVASARNVSSTEFALVRINP